MGDAGRVNCGLHGLAEDLLGGQKAGASLRADPGDPCSLDASGSTTPCSGLVPSDRQVDVASNGGITHDRRLDEPQGGIAQALDHVALLRKYSCLIVYLRLCLAKTDTIDC